MADLGIDFQKLQAELANLLTLACLHCNSGEISYQGVTLKVKDMFFRNFEMLLIKTCVQTAGKKAAMSLSATYQSSFADFPGWSSEHDLKLLTAVSTCGFGRWREVLGGLLPGQDTYDLYKLVCAEEASLDAAENFAWMERFAEMRTRFLVYCLMEDEYLCK